MPAGELADSIPKPFAFEQQAQRFQHVRLIVGDENPSVVCQVSLDWYKS